MRRDLDACIMYGASGNTQGLASEYDFEDSNSVDMDEEREYDDPDSDEGEYTEFI